MCANAQEGSNIPPQPILPRGVSVQVKHVLRRIIYISLFCHMACAFCIYIYLDLQSGTFTGSGAGLPTPAFFWIWSGSFSKSPYVDSQGFACFADRISVKVNPLLMQ